MKRWLKVVVAVLALLLLVPVAFVVRMKLFPPTFPVQSIAQYRHHKDPTLLREAWSLPVARTYKPRLDFQDNPSICGPTSVGNVLRSFGEQPTRARDVLVGSDKCQWFGICPAGLTLDEVADLLRAKSARRVTVLRGLSLDDFRRELKHSNDLSRRYLINFQRGLLFGQGTGHHSPIGGYLPAHDLVFVLDVNEKFGAWLVKTDRLFTAMDSPDSSTGQKRGLLRIE